MGVWDWLTGKKSETNRNSAPSKRKRGQRGPGKSRAERDAAERARFERDLRRNFPDQYRRLKLAEWYRLSPDEADEFLTEAKRSEKRDELLRDVLPAGLQLLTAMMQAKNGPPPLPVQPPALPPPSVPAAPPAPIAAPAVPPAPAPVSVPASAPTIAQELIAEMGSRNPGEAATWLHRRPESGARQFVTALVSVPDEQIRDVLATAAQLAPDLAPAMTWLQAPERWDWTVSTVRELRRLAGAATR